ncbi:hypothetical protein I552_6827 [Mycobacterium xenopi 3993]|nr:hypothetical protein I552_6827 [Mycobacterium xenopi 3993]
MSLSLSAARAAATPSAVAPTLSVMSQVSLSVRATVAPYLLVGSRHSTPTIWHAVSIVSIEDRAG